MSINILILDDPGQSLDELVRNIKAAHPEYNVFFANTFEDGLKLIGKHYFDEAYLNTRLEGEEDAGRKFADEIKRQYPNNIGDIFGMTAQISSVKENKWMPYRLLVKKSLTKEYFSSHAIKSKKLLD